MSTYKEIVYMVMDELKLTADDSMFTDAHVLFLINKYRAFLLKLRYSDIKKYVPESNYQTICLDLIEVPAISGEACEGCNYLRTKDKIPFAMNIGSPRVYPIDFYQGEITYVSRDRMRYVGHNKFTLNIIYCSLAPDNYIYLKSMNPQFLYLEKVKFTGVFSDVEAAFDLQCPLGEGDESCDIVDSEFPIEDALVPPLIELVVKELQAPVYKPEDEANNAEDDLSKVVTSRS